MSALPLAAPETAQSSTATRPASAFPATTAAVVALVVTALFVLTQLYAAIPLIAPISADLGGDSTFALSTAFSLSYAIGFLIWGPLADQYGHRRVLMIGLAALAATTLGTALSSTLPALGTLRALQGFTAASFAPVALAYLAEAVHPRRRPLAIGAMSTAFLVAGVAGQVLASTVALAIGWPWVFGLSGAILVVCLGGVAVMLAEPQRPLRAGRLAQQFAALARVARMPRMLLLAVAHLTLLLGFVAMYTAVGPHVETLGLDAAQVIWLRLAGLPGMFAALAVGPLARRLGTDGVARLGFAIGAAGLVAEALLSASLVGIAATSLIYVVGVALAIPAMITLFGETAAPQRAGGMALNGFVLFLGASLGPLVAAIGVPFPALLSRLAGLALLAVLSLTVFARPRRDDATRAPQRVA
ncbi:MFS transporter [Microbacterium sp. KUDC0406]|uniref:MFS transporter n=1 Tax=Microbacterium sp. KUDC0406 TaxID=2909588 RepID=UPI001F227747|nr:MFS transporter [Microbacterium sp. KUDC0406]UJP10953.1 MFS transporter [Microbacterium sp. KUDC0406]